MAEPDSMLGAKVDEVRSARLRLNGRQPINRSFTRHGGRVGAGHPSSHAYSPAEMMVYAIIRAVDPSTLFLYWDGVIPVVLENARVKWAGEVK